MTGDPPMPVCCRTKIGLLVFVGVGSLAGLLIWLQPWRRSEPPPAPDFPLPPYSQTRFANTGPDARFIGVKACAECHDRQHQSYLHTAHSRALGDVDLADEPPDGDYFHKASGRSYRVYRHGKTVRHEETLRSAEGKEIARVDLPIRYRIGSGSFTRSYLVEVDGFLHQSPITWYTSRRTWDMSPGYDKPNHFSFERRVGQECLFCHAGRVEPAGAGVHQVKLHEQVIGCESCHGPGSLHQDLHRTGKFTVGQEDLTIVNPGKLPRPLLEAVCSTCHLSSAANVLLRGRGPSDFRPGRPSTDFRIDYQLDIGHDQMTVVGHMEQLRRSACYQKSTELTCLTCHDPHARARPKDPAAHHRQQCLNCHATKPCGLDQATRLKKDAADNCIACHMPRGDTEIPHIAFTHHRIGLHPSPKSPEPERIPDLVPTDDVARIPAIDRQRNLGMAYVLASHDQAYARYGDEFRRRAEEILTKVHAAGLCDDDATATLIELYQQSDPDRGEELARQLLSGKGLSAYIRANVQLLVATHDVRDHKYGSAAFLLGALTRSRRSADDWRMLGNAHLAMDEPAKALPVLEQALAMRPFRPSIHASLAKAYHSLGKKQLADEHQAKAVWLHEHGQD